MVAILEIKRSIYEYCIHAPSLARVISHGARRRRQGRPGVAPGIGAPAAGDRDGRPGLRVVREPSAAAPVHVFPATVRGRNRQPGRTQRSRGAAPFQRTRHDGLPVSHRLLLLRHDHALRSPARRRRGRDGRFLRADAALREPDALGPQRTRRRRDREVRGDGPRRAEHH